MTREATNPGHCWNVYKRDVTGRQLLGTGRSAQCWPPPTPSPVPHTQAIIAREGLAIEPLGDGAHPSLDLESIFENLVRFQEVLLST